MTTVAHTDLTVQFDTALRTLAATARTRYAGEAARIERALVIALNGGVTLKADAALVSSTRDDEVFYIVRDGHCDCPDFPRAPGGRCKHRFAVCLVKKAQAAFALRYYATYAAPDGSVQQGVVTIERRGWHFVPDDGGEPVYAAAHALALGGNVAIAEAKRAEEEAAGGLAAIVCGYGR